MNQKDISLELYKVFYSVAKHLSFSAAAKELYISQSAVSQSIRTLENKLGTPLFHRSTKKVTLTTDGNEMLKYVEPAINLLETGQATISEGYDLKRGKLHIGASDTICRYYLLDYLSNFHQIYPGVTIQITNRTSIDCVKLLDQGQVDFIITNMPNDYVTKDMSAQAVKTFKDVFVADKSFSSQLSDKISMKELIDYPLLMLEPNTTTFEFLNNKFHQLGYQLEPEVKLGSIDLLMDMARIGIGISYVPDYCIKDESSLHIIEIAEQLPERQLAVVTHRKHPLSEAGRTFINMLSDGVAIGQL